MAKPLNRGKRPALTGTATSNIPTGNGNGNRANSQRRKPLGAGGIARQAEIENIKVGILPPQYRSQRLPCGSS